MSGRVEKHQNVVVFLFFFFFCLCTFPKRVRMLLSCISRCSLSSGAVRLDGPCANMFKRNAGIL